MARDRLANLRQGQGYASQQSYGQIQNDYPMRQTPSVPQPSAYSGGQNAYAGQAGPYSSRYQSQQPEQTELDMGQASMPPGSAPMGGAQDDEQQFFSDIREIQSAIKDLNDNISRIADLHARSLDTLANDAQHAQISQNLNNMTEDTRTLSNSLKGAIKRLEGQTAKRDARDPNTNVRRTQVGAVKNRFMEAIQRYQTVEQDSRKRQRQKMERQFRIVKPDASPQEVQEALDSSGQGTQMFQQALLNSNRYGDARNAYREVQDRHAEIQKIEQTITELAQMFNDMAIMVEEQDPGIQAVEAKAQEAETDMHQAEGQMQKAVKSARAARKKRWICFGIVVVILIIIAIVLAVYFTTRDSGDSGGGNNNQGA